MASLPLLYKMTLQSWAKKNLKNINPGKNAKAKVYFFIDEFTDFNDTEIGIKTIKLLCALGYNVEIVSQNRHNP